MCYAFFNFLQALIKLIQFTKHKLQQTANQHMILSQKQIHDDLRKNNLSKQQKQLIVKSIRKGGYDMPDVVFQYSYQLLKANHNSEQRFINFDQLIHSALKIKITPITIKKYLTAMIKQVGKTAYLEKLGAFINFATNKEIKKSQLQPLLKQDFGDLQTKKRLISSYKRQGRIDDYVKKLNAYVQQNSSDIEVWIELSQIYTQKGHYLKALFCLQQIVVIAPENDHYMIKLAELYYTHGGKQNLPNAMKYYSYVISRCPTNLRALWGLYRTLLLIGDKNEANKQLKQHCYDAIHKIYSKKNSQIKFHIAL